MVRLQQDARVFPYENDICNGTIGVITNLDKQMYKLYFVLMTLLFIMDYKARQLFYNNS